MNLIHDGEDLKNGPFKLGKLYAHELSRRVIEESPALKRRKTSSKRTQDNMNADEDLRKLSRLLSDRMDYDEGSGDDAIASPCVVVQWLRNIRCHMIAGVTTGCWLLTALSGPSATCRHNTTPSATCRHRHSTTSFMMMET